MVGFEQYSDSGLLKGPLIHSAHFLQGERQLSLFEETLRNFPEGQILG